VISTHDGGTRSASGSGHVRRTSVPVSCWYFHLDVGFEVDRYDWYNGRRHIDDIGWLSAGLLGRLVQNAAFQRFVGRATKARRRRRGRTQTLAVFLLFSLCSLGLCAFRPRDADRPTDGFNECYNGGQDL